jgi:hypothetical protein
MKKRLTHYTFKSCAVTTTVVPNISLPTKWRLVSIRSGDYLFLASSRGFLAPRFKLLQEREISFSFRPIAHDLEVSVLHAAV